MTHTREPWEHDGKGDLFIAEPHRTIEPVCCGNVLPSGECCGNPVAGEGEPEWEFAQVGSMSPDDAERARVCVNALAGIETAEIEAGVVNEMVKKLRLAKLCIETIGETDGSVEREIDAVLARLGRQS